jgi:hypothetical protein
MDKIISDLQTRTTFKYTVYSGNNSRVVREILDKLYRNSEEVSADDEKHCC